MESLPPLAHEVEEPQLPPHSFPRSSPSSSQENHSAASSPPSRAGTKRPASSLLPPFEPFSSSPGLPRPMKRRNTSGNAAITSGSGRNASGTAGLGITLSNAPHLKYPTPVPTSSTGILSSSPPRVYAGAIRYPDARDASLGPQQEPPQRSRPSLVRTASERAPLSAVPTVELPENGELVVMGRSSNSCHYQLSANRLISRSHVKARYIPDEDASATGKIEIICCGWNGLKLHCQGRTWELFKGDSFTSETEADIMLDVQDARVMVQWPRRGHGNGEPLSAVSDSSLWGGSPASIAGGPSSLLPSSPLRRTIRVHSPESPTLAHLSSSQRLQALLPEEDSIQIYEDEPELPGHGDDGVDVGVSMRTEVTASFSSDLSEPDDNENEQEPGLDDPDEENDPIVHSFGPFGADIAGRMASIMSQSPKAQQKPSKRLLESNHPSSTDSPTRGRSSLPASPKKRSVPDGSLDQRSASPLPSLPISPSTINHAVNQLAFSRLSSTPLSTIMQHLPVEDREGLNHAGGTESLRCAIEATPAIGIIPRQGKDAAGKALESEYYYVPEEDDDEQRRAAVVDGLRKPSLRNCRKQHKQYYWKRPRTP